MPKIEAQEVSYYIEAYQKEDLEPISQTYENDYLSLKFSDTQLTKAFKDVKVLNYSSLTDDLELCEELDNVFEVTVEEPITDSVFRNNSSIKYIEEVPEVELNTGGLPDDYYIPTFDENDDPLHNGGETPGDSIRNDYLDLIQAPCAWELTHGDPDVLVGVSDSYFNEAHEELEGKFEAILLDSNQVIGNYSHGIESSSLIAGNTNNGKGTASIGYNTRLVGNYYGDSKYIKELAKWSYEHDNKIRVINMSWGSLVDTTAITNIPNDLQIQSEVYQCIRDQYNIALVASSANKSNIDSSKTQGCEDSKSKCNIPNHHFNLPASFESVISVSMVGSRHDRMEKSGGANMKDVLWYWSTTYDGQHRTTGILNDSVDIVAPGFDVYRAVNTRQGKNGEDSVDDYTKEGVGTSIAAPIVSGTLALMFAVNPELTPVEAKKILKTTGDRIEIQSRHS